MIYENTQMAGFDRIAMIRGPTLTDAMHYWRSPRR